MRKNPTMILVGWTLALDGGTRCFKEMIDLVIIKERVVKFVFEIFEEKRVDTLQLLHLKFLI